MNKALKQNKRPWKSTRYYRIYRKRNAVGLGLAFSIISATAHQMAAIKSVPIGNAEDATQLKINKANALTEAVINGQSAALKALTWWRK